MVAGSILQSFERSDFTETKEMRSLHTFVAFIMMVIENPSNRSFKGFVALACGGSGDLLRMIRLGEHVAESGERLR